MDDFILNRKTMPILDRKVDEREDGFYVSGYANTKGSPDAYGDIPMNFNGEPVYDFSVFGKNPVAVTDHKNSIGSIFGVFTEYLEDDTGLFVTLRLMDNPQTDVAKHAVEAFKTGYARAFSIGGIWKYQDKQNKSHLTKAIIHEISGVAIGADSNAVAHLTPKKSMPDATNAHNAEVVSFLISEYRKTNDPTFIKTINSIIRRKK